VPISINSEIYFIKSLQKTLCIEYIYLFISIKRHIFILIPFYFFLKISHQIIIGFLGILTIIAERIFHFENLIYQKNLSKCFIQLNLKIMFINYAVFLFFS